MAGTVLLPHDVSNTQYGFTCDPSADTGSTFLPPAATGGWVVSSNAINDSGVYVGTLANSSNTLHEGLLLQPIRQRRQRRPGPDPQRRSIPAASRTTPTPTPSTRAAWLWAGRICLPPATVCCSADVCNINGSGAMVDLGTLGTGDYSQAEGINSSGEIVGYSNLTPVRPPTCLCVNSTGGMTTILLSFRRIRAGIWEEATAVNDSGWIVGYGINSAGSIDGFLLEPVPVVHNPGQCITSDPVVDINDLTIVLTELRPHGVCLVARLHGSWGDPTGTVDINDLTIVLASLGRLWGSRRHFGRPRALHYHALACLCRLPARLRLATAGLTVGTRAARKPASSGRVPSQDVPHQHWGACGLKMAAARQVGLAPSRRQRSIPPPVPSRIGTPGAMW